jgi:hypothetical protein
MKAKKVTAEAATLEGEFIEVAETNLPEKTPVPPLQLDTSSDKFYRLVELAIEKGTGVEQLEKLMELNSKWEAAQAKTAFLQAKTLFQTALPIIKKQKVVSFDTKAGGKMSYNYASLDDIAETIKPFLAQYGFSYRWNQTFADGGVMRVQCVLTHEAGHSEACDMVGGADTSGLKNALQASASGITYMRRYTLTGVLGIATADEDIDARLPIDNNPTDSDTLNDMLTPDPQTGLIAEIQAAIDAAANVQDLKAAGVPINALPEGKPKAEIKAVYIAKLKALRETKAE